MDVVESQTDVRSAPVLPLTTQARRGPDRGHRPRPGAGHLARCRRPRAHRGNRGRAAARRRRQGADRARAGCQGARRPQHHRPLPRRDPRAEAVRPRAVRGARAAAAGADLADRPPRVRGDLPLGRRRQRHRDDLRDAVARHARRSGVRLVRDDRRRQAALRPRADRSRRSPRRAGRGAGARSRRCRPARASATSMSTSTTSSSSMRFYRDGLGFGGLFIIRQFGMGDVGLDYTPHTIAFNIWSGGPNAKLPPAGVAGLRWFTVVVPDAGSAGGRPRAADGAGRRR